MNSRVEILQEILLLQSHFFENVYLVIANCCTTGGSHLLVAESGVSEGREEYEVNEEIQAMWYNSR